MKMSLIGNPNCGKTTLFNVLTGSKQRVGNWSGVTVERKEGTLIFEDQRYEIIDLPGIYALNTDETTSQDEWVARHYLTENPNDLVVNIIDASNLQRSLYLTYQLLDLGVPLIVVLNMMDEVEYSGEKINIDILSAQLGCPVVPISAAKKKGLAELKKIMTAQAKARTVPNPKLTTLTAATEAQIAQLKASVPSDSIFNQATRSELFEILIHHQQIDLSAQEQNALEQCNHSIADWCDHEVDVALASSRYESIDQLCKKVIETPREASVTLTDKLDKWVLNRFVGIPIFLLMMYFMFLIAIKFGSVFIDFFEGLFGAIFVDGFAFVLDSIHSPDWMIAILTNGIGTGIQTVATFVPVIAAMFLCLSFLEDSGYLARAAMVVDRGMRAIGLPGKAFVPMLVGFGCNVPAIMGTRTLDNAKDRILAICMIPFMSCGARLPVYALLAVAFLPNHATTVVFSLYILGILIAILTGFILKRTLLKGENSPFLMEMPVYRIPTLRNLLGLTWLRLKGFILKAGQAIVIMVTILSVLNSLGTDGSFGNEDTDKSVLSSISKSVTPIFEPMGITEENWPATVGIFTGIFAKEAVIATLNSLYSEPEAEEEFDFWGEIEDAFKTIPENLIALSDSFLDPLGFSEIDDGADEMSEASFNKIQVSFGTTAAAMAYLIFILLYTPCTAALGAIFREAGFKWMLFVALWTFALGWLVATLYYQVLEFNSHSLYWIFGILIFSILAVIVMRIKGSKEMNLPDQSQNSRSKSNGCCH